MNSEKEGGKSKNQVTGTLNKPPAPPKSSRPAPPKSSRPAPPPTKTNQITPHIVPSISNDEESTRNRAISSEKNGDYSEAAIFYRSLGLSNDENRCLQLAL